VSLRTVLIADDSPLVRRMIQKMLEAAGLNVVTAADGLEALEKAASEDVAMVILDVGMPRMNGYQACRLLKTEPTTRDLPVVILTTRDQAGDRYWGAETGADYYITKDAEPQRIVDLVKNILAERAPKHRERAEAGPRTTVDILSRVNQLLDRKLYEATLLSDLGRLARSSVEFDETFAAVMGVVARATDFGLGGMGFVEGDDFDLVVTLRRPAAAAAVEEACGRILQAVVEARGEPFGRVQRRLVASGVASGPEQPGLPDLLTVPVVATGRMAGVLALAGGAVSRISPETLTFLEALAGQAHIVLENSRLFARVRELSIRDSLTGLYNHRHVLELVAQAVERADRYQEPVSLLMADIDHFKGVNDEHGHLAGDALLRQLADVLTDSVRSVDAVGRYGGEEFVMLLPHTGYEEARRLAERIRARVQSCAFRVGERTHRMTLSLGVFSCPSPIVSTAADLVREADRALYRAKGTGRNRVK
jgi:two-component system, cell cycle response regulator